LNLDAGGAERQLLRILVEFARVAPDVSLSVVALDGKARQDLKPLFDDAGLPVFLSPYSRRDPRALTWLAGHLRRTRPDIVHSWLWNANAAAGLTSALGVCRHLILAEQGDKIWAPYWSPAAWWKRAIDRVATFRRADWVVSNSQAGVAPLIRAGCLPEKTLVIPNGIDLEEVDAQRAGTEAVRRQFGWEGRYVLGFVGRLSPEKRPLDFVALAKQLTTKWPDHPLAFVMVGDGPERPAVEAWLRANHMGDQVTLTGRVSSPVALMHAMDAGVLCSTLESSPNVLFEFMACGRPVVATAVGGVPEVLRDGQTGLLVPLGSIDALVNACHTLLEDRNRAAAWGAAGRRDVEAHYQMHLVARRYLDLYERTLAAD
jgi:glycosyltransferase involved in cell wall biosynthesis